MPPEVVWKAPPPPKPRRHGARTEITHAPAASLSDATAGVAVRLNGVPAPNTPRPKLSPRVAGVWTNIGPYEVFHPISTLEPCTSYTMTVPARTFALRHRTLGSAHTLTFGVACPGITADAGGARAARLPAVHAARLRRRVDIGRLTRKQAARRAYVLPHGKLLPTTPARRRSRSGRSTRRRPARSRSSRPTSGCR